MANADDRSSKTREELKFEKSWVLSQYHMGDKRVQWKTIRREAQSSLGRPSIREEDEEQMKCFLPEC